MKKKHREPEKQLNTQVSPAVVPEETYSLEDIMREFGGWTPREEQAEVDLLWTPKAEPKQESKPEAPPLVVKKKPEPPLVVKKPEDLTVEAPEETPKDVPAEPAPQEEPKPPLVLKEVSVTVTPKEGSARAEIMRVAAAEQEKPKHTFKLIDLSGDTIPFQAVREEDLQEQEPEIPAASVEMPEEPEHTPDKKQEKADQKAQKRSEHRLKKQEAQRRKAQKAALRAARREEPEVVYPSPEDACKAYAKAGSLRIRLLITGLVTLGSILLLFLSRYSLAGFDLTAQTRLLSLIIVACLLGQCVLSYEIFVRGIYQALRMRFDLMSLLTLTVMVTVGDSFFAISEGRIPFCTVPSVALWLALWSLALEKKAKWRTLKTVLAMDAPVAAVKEEKSWNGLDCIFRRDGSLEDFTAMLETPDAAQKVMRVYAPVAAVLTLIFALVAAFLDSGSLLWAWSVLLLAALPGGGFIACCRPFSILAKRLHLNGAAICGWRGAKLLSGECGIVIEDKDLFPAGNISMNGMKMYSDLPVRQVVGYATAVIQAANSGLLPLFEEVMKNENGRRCSVDSFRQYEGGGLGAEIRGDVVLLGSLAFMRLMGVHVPESTKVQSAVYISVNKELVGVFALSYQPSAGTRSGLHQVLRSTGMTPVLATRDFMITPSLVKKRYKIAADRLEFPVVAERIQLSSPEAGSRGKQGALMSKGSFLSYASAVAGGRLLRRAVHSAVAVSLIGGILGMALMSVLTYLGAVEAASAANLLLYQLLWLFPGLLITGLLGKT